MGVVDGDLLVLRPRRGCQARRRASARFRRCRRPRDARRRFRRRRRPRDARREQAEHEQGRESMPPAPLLVAPGAPATPRPDQRVHERPEQAAADHQSSEPDPDRRPCGGQSEHPLRLGVRWRDLGEAREGGVEHVGVGHPARDVGARRVTPRRAGSDAHGSVGGEGCHDDVVQRGRSRAIHQRADVVAHVFRRPAQHERPLACLSGSRALPERQRGLARAAGRDDVDGRRVARSFVEPGGFLEVAGREGRVALPDQRRRGRRPRGQVPPVLPILFLGGDPHRPRRARIQEPEQPGCKDERAHRRSHACAAYISGASRHRVTIP